MNNNFKFKITNSKLEKLLENTGDMALKRRARSIIGGLELKQGDKILDVGCGDGYYLHLLSNLGLQLNLTGTDYSRFDLKRARKNLKGKKIKLVFGDLMKKLAFKSDSFDKAMMSEVLEHLPDDLKGLKEVRRIIKKNGILCLTVPCHNYPFLWDPINWTLEHFFSTHIKAGFFAGLWNQHLRLYTKEQIIKTVKKAGFKVLEVRCLTFWSLPFNHYIVNVVARALASGQLKEKTKNSLSKYTKSPKRSLFLDLAFGLVNLIDRLNDFYQPRDSGVAVFVKAIK